LASLPRVRADKPRTVGEQHMTHALDGVVVQLAVGRPYFFRVAGFEGLTQGSAQSFRI